MTTDPDKQTEILSSEDKVSSFGGYQVISDKSCCCSGRVTTQACSSPSSKQSFVVGEHQARTGQVPRTTAQLSSADRFGAFKARWGVGRMNYSILPGLCALGEPDAESEVLVSANYKLSFDKLRSSVPGRNVWILVLETFGINVWCAAGKGTFGTSELVARIDQCRLGEVVNHRRIIVPQLGAPGIAAHVVKKQSGFQVVYGPICAYDLPDFLDAGRKATPNMRKKRFPAWERAALIPVELVTALKTTFLLAVAFFFLSGLGGPGGYWYNTMNSGLLSVFGLLAALIGGAVLFPLLLPWLPGRAFSFKSLPIGIALALLAVAWKGDNTHIAGLMESAAWLLMVTSLTAFMAMNFTGASTYTNLSGVKKEMRVAVPSQIAAASIGLAVWIASRAIA